MSKPQLVLLPGAWHKPEHYSLVAPKLEAAGYTIHTRQLPSVTDSNPPKDLSEDIAAVQELVTKAIDSGNDVIVIAHSWAGLVAGSSLSGFGKKEREARGEKGGVVRVGYMCAFVAPEGASLTDNLDPNERPDWWSIEGEFGVLKPHARDHFYHDLLPAERDHWFSKVSLSHGLGSWTDKAPAASWKEIPSSYLVCEDDRTIPSFAQDAMSGMMKEMGAEVEISRINSGHSPFLSKPDEAVAWVRKVAGEQI